MAPNLRGVTAVLLAGTGSDDDYVYRVFSAALHDVGAVVTTPPPVGHVGPPDAHRHEGDERQPPADRGFRGHAL